MAWSWQNTKKLQELITVTDGKKLDIEVADVEYFARKYARFPNMRSAKQLKLLVDAFIISKLVKPKEKIDA